MSSDNSSYPTQHTEGDSSASGPSINENWASPSELLEMRTMWSAIVTQHRAEMAALQAALERSHQQQQVYLKELQETHRLRHLYAAAAADQERIVEERKVWAQERLLLEQELQKLRLGQGMGMAPSDTTTTTGWSGSTPSSGAAPSTHAVLLAIAQEENVALHEALARHAKERHELEQRLAFVQTAASMQQRSLQSRCDTQTGDIDRLRLKLKALSTDVHRYASELATSRAEVTALQVAKGTLEGELAHQRDAIEREKANSDAELAARLQALAKDWEVRHGAQVASLEASLEDASRAREALRGQVERSIMAKASSAEAYQTQLEALEVALDESRMLLRRSEEDGLLARRAAQQAQGDFTDRLQQESEARIEMNTQRTALLMRLDALQGQLSVSEADNCRKSTEIEHLQAQVAMLMGEVDSMRDATASTLTVHGMATQLASEIETQRGFYEDQLAQHSKAMELLQVKHGEDKKTLMDLLTRKEMSRRDRKGNPTRQSGADPSPAAEGKSGKENGQQVEGKKVRHSRGAELAVDALQLMRMNASMAEKCALSMGRV